MFPIKQLRFWWLKKREKVWSARVSSLNEDEHFWRRTAYAEDKENELHQARRKLSKIRRKLTNLNR